MKEATKDVTKLAYRRVSAAAALDVSTDTIDRLIARGELRAARMGRAIAIPAEDLHSYLERCTEPGVR